MLCNRTETYAYLTWSILCICANINGDSSMSVFVMLIIVAIHAFLLLFSFARMRSRRVIMSSSLSSASASIPIRRSCMISVGGILNIVKDYIISFAARFSRAIIVIWLSTLGIIVCAPISTRDVGLMIGICCCSLSRGSCSITNYFTADTSSDITRWRYFSATTNTNTKHLHGNTFNHIGLLHQKN